MAVRRIPVHRRSVTGKVASTREAKMIRTESSLETDFVLLMEGDPNVARIEEQPVRIDYRDAEGQARHYTPDFLVTFHGNEPALLVEVKYQAYLDEHGPELAERFAAAERYARERGWTFDTYTEHDIRGPLLTNLKFLQFFRKPGLSARYVDGVLEQVRTLRLTTPRDVLASMTPLAERQAQVLPALWHLVATRRVSADLSEPLTMVSRLWPAEGQEYAP